MNAFERVALSHFTEEQFCIECDLEASESVQVFSEKSFLAICEIYDKELIKIISELFIYLGNLIPLLS